MKPKSILILTALLIGLLIATTTHAAAPSGVVTLNLSPAVEAPNQAVKLWVPYPMSDAFQTITDVRVTGNFDASQVLRDPGSGAVYLYATWDKAGKKPSASLSFHVSQTDRRNTQLTEVDAPFPVPVNKYRESTTWVPAADVEMQGIAAKAVKGKEGTLEKAKAVYDWVVENTYRDPKVKGCGLGIPSRTLNECGGGGKCADLSTVFVTLARAAGIPARDVYGLRLSSPKEGDITSAFHCWAEFYLPGTGWVMVDPADVRKMMLVHNVKLKDADEWRRFFWGGDDLFRVVLQKDARGAALEGASAPLNYFMYPAAEVDGKMLNYFDSKAFHYNVTFAADAGK
ncbi:transglutaminase-like domain-containing protein [Desulfoluna spongiiphila]|uniref:Transglutaminase-like enzyme, putative cysteine protease n=1 Tax=Desulfoluna spongiiphila TaxID=419481 RepID=A0A1G5GD88_9BACT|nr:transglutaminase-like domain-containing protein [Desulfoluna spongiiphila]SCY49311.1 Transglutaminase-like enzyme, putative cysteine protease [Desulfoluna spongiiphila]